MFSRRQPEIAILFLLGCSLLSAPARAQVSPATKSGATHKPESASSRLDAIIASGRLDDLRWPDFSGYRSHLISFYRPLGYQLAWVRNGQPTPQALELIQILENADREGLRAEDYDASRWADRLNLLRGPHTAGAEARIDAALSVSIMRYLSDLHVGRINPQHVGFEFDLSRKKLDLPTFIREQLVNGSNLQSEVAGVEPQFPAYQRLRDALPHYIDLAKQDDGEKLPNPIYMDKGEQYAGTARMTRLLRLLGDLPQNADVPAEAKIYQGPLVDAVKHFQARHGLLPNGIVDTKTIAEMNVPLGERVQQMRLGLERYRWSPYDFNESAVLVNIPEFRLYAFDQGGKIALSMRVNVGDDYDFQTPVFEKNMLYLVFRPYWYPPPGILRQEIIPELEQDTSLEENDLELVSATGRVMSTGNVTPAILQQIRSGTMTARQPPGPDNALGLVKFMFPNQHHVYIHDTPISVHMFSDKERTYSHGCIHAQEPDKLAAWLLRDLPNWDLEHVDYAMHKGPDNVRVNLPSPVPVFIVYDTVAVADNGDVQFFPDIYGHDGVLEEELEKGYPYARRGDARN
ncbi:MAG TPA: L,D-transpeptidase family protein [Acidobacteriaceae bacterium]|nr:L,D-transpeptidase family protein [Acidobacteriaceae bacterium]